MYEEPDYSEAEFIDGHYDENKDWVYDPKGYFLIRINNKTKKLEAGYCKQTNKIIKVITGKKASEVYFTIIEQGLVSRQDHAAYLGKELAKAEFALKNNLEYVQDDDLNL
jgi:tetrahydromethanopterin S-methyltransferase subunit A